MTFSRHTWLGSMERLNIASSCVETKPKNCCENKLNMQKRRRSLVGGWCRIYCFMGRHARESNWLCGLVCSHQSHPNWFSIAAPLVVLSASVLHPSLARTFSFAIKMSWHWLLASGLAMMFYWPSFSGNPDLLRAGGLHPTEKGTAILSRDTYKYRQDYGLDATGVHYHYQQSAMYTKGSVWLVTTEHLSSFSTLWLLRYSPG